MKILVIEDNEIARMAIAAFLRGHEIELASTLNDGLEGLKKEPDLVITDWNLGNDTNTADIVDYCLEKGIRVVIQTGSPFADDLDEMRSRGIEIIHKLDLRNEIKGNIENIGKSGVEC